MNYVELHIGDFERDTAHLTACEEGVYNRLLRLYYKAEGPLVNDVPALQRLVRARSKDEKAAVPAMLSEFFALVDGSWVQGRCDKEIAKYQDKRAKAQRSAKARWNDSEGNADAMRTHSDGNAHQTPDTRHQSEAASASPVVSVVLPTAAGLACRLMREAGCGQSNPNHPDLLAALAEGITPEALAATVSEARDAGVRKPFAWAIATARGRHAEGAREVVIGPAKTLTPSRQFTALAAGQALIEEAREREQFDQPDANHPRLVHG